MSVDLTGRTALVTGASSGIGRNFAKALAVSDANVVLTARRAAMLDQLQQDISGAGGQALAVPMDATDQASTVAAFDAAEEKYGYVDTVIANAGVNIGGSALGLAIEHFDAMVALNLRGIFLTAREAARRMIARGSPQDGRGRIVIISSTTGVHAMSGIATYGATKAAVIQLGRALAKEWALKGINVNVIAPGYMQTDMTEELWLTHQGKKIMADFPRRRVMDTDALNDTLLYLCSDSSSHITGSVFIIDDGQSL